MMIPDYQATFRSICMRPGMYVPSRSMSCVCAYISGFDAARDGGPLKGLREWLVVRCDGGNNLGWESLALDLLEDSSGATASAFEEQLAGLADLLDEFFRARSERGLGSVYHEYRQWLLRQQWFRDDLLDRP